MSDDRFAAVRPPGEQLAIHRERLISLKETTTRHEEKIEELETNFGTLMAEVGGVKNEVKALRAELGTKLDPILAQYWNDHPSKMQHAPFEHRESPIPPSRVSAIGSAAKTYGPMVALIAALRIIEALVTFVTHPAQAAQTPTVQAPKP